MPIDSPMSFFGPIEPAPTTAPGSGGWATAGNFFNSLANAYATVQGTEPRPIIQPVSFLGTRPLTESNITGGLGTAVMLIGALALIVITVRAVKG